MLTVQMASGTVLKGRKNGSSQSRYHEYTTGADKSDAAMGQAKASGDNSAEFLPIQYRGKKAGENRQPCCNVWSGQALEHRKYRIIKTKALHVGA